MVVEEKTSMYMWPRALQMMCLFGISRHKLHSVQEEQYTRGCQAGGGGQISGSQAGSSPPEDCHLVLGLIRGLKDRNSSTSMCHAHSLASVGLTQVLHCNDLKVRLGLERWLGG